MAKTFKHAPHVMIGAPMKPLMDNLDNLSPRECVIIGLAVIDTMLQLALRSNFKSEDDRERVFDPGQALHSFAARVSMAYHFGLIPKSMRCDLERLNQIRTRFAHDFAEYDFETKDPDIASLCEKLELPFNYELVGQWIADHSNGAVAHRVDDDTPETLNKVFFTDSAGYIGVVVDVSPETVNSNRGRFTTTIRLSWGHLASRCKDNLLMPSGAVNLPASP